jgi:GH15 family glucan-1,4-alpha-glucosidase
MTTETTAPQADPRPLEADRRDGYLPIGAYAAIGDSRTLALVGTDGALDWMCLPELDAPSLFGAIIDPERGGRFVLQPAAPFTSTRSYVERTNVLQTVFTTEQGTVRVTDALTVDTAQTVPWRELVRHVEGLGGEVPMHWVFDPRFEFGREQPEWRPFREALVARHGRLHVGLQTWEAGADETRRAGRFSVSEGEEAWLVMTAADGNPLPLPDLASVRRRLRRTCEVWRAYVENSTYDGDYRDAVNRSLLAIRLLADGRTGAITAAGTTSLPEVVGGQRNYDYRFGWVRDASFTLEALLGAGIDELTQASVTWMLRSLEHTQPRVDPVYTLTGEVVRSQHSIALPGYRRTEPVNVGNQAGSQLQLGGFGDVLDTLHAYADAGHVLHPSTGERLADICDLLGHIWRNEDAGLWELSQYAQYGTSKLGVWTAFDRLLDLVEQGQAPARHVGRWQREREAVRAFIEERLWSQEKQSYLQKAGSDALDCGMLLASRRRFGDPAGERMRGTIEAIQRELSAGPSLLYRYSGMQEQENAFLACSFWMVQALAYAGRVDEARQWMEGALAVANDVDLMSEEYDPGAHELRGNFPQALTHLSVINAALAIEQCARG